MVRCPLGSAQVHKRFATPANSIVVMGVIGGALAMTGAFVEMAIISTLARMIGYLVCVAAIPKVRATSGKPVQGVLKIALSFVAPLVAAVLTVWAISQATSDAWLRLGLFVIVGTALYAFSRWRSRARPV